MKTDQQRAPPAARSKDRVAGRIATGIILTLVICFILILPEVVRRVTLNQLENIFTVPVRIGDVDLNLFTGRARIDDLLIGNDPRPILRLPAIRSAFSRSALLKAHINFEDIVLQDPALFIERIGTGSYNILKAVHLAKGNGNGAGITINRLEIQSGEIVFIDHTQKPDYKIVLNSLNLAAGPISTLPQASVTSTTFEGAVQIGDGSMRVVGSTNPLQKPLSVELKAEISNVELQAFDVYLPYGGRLNLEKSLLNGQTRYVLRYRGEEPAEHYLNANLKIGGLGILSAPASQPILQTSGLRAQNIHLDFLTNRAVVGALTIEEPYLLVARDSAGLNLAQLFAEGKTTPRKPAQNEADSNQMSVSIKHAEAENGTIEFVDQTVSPTVKSPLQDVSLTAEDIDVLPDIAIARIEAEGRLGNGLVQVTGGFRDQPVNSQLTVAGKSLPFQPFRGYLDQLFSSANSNGELLSGKLKLVFTPEKSGKVGVEISGTLEGHDMGLRFPDQQNPFLTTQRLGVDLGTIRLGSNPRVDINEIKFTGANLSVLRNRDGKLNLSPLWVSDSQERSKPKQDQDQHADEKKMPIAIRLISMDKSAIGIVDASVSPSYNTKLSRVAGKLSNLCEKAPRVELQLHGTLGDSANLTL